MKTFRRSQPVRRRSGFTLLELLIVLGIIVALAAMVVPNLIGNQQEALLKIAQGDIKTLENACKTKAVKMNGVFEAGTGSELLRKLAEPWEDAQGRKQQQELDEVPLDPWGHEYQYSYESGDVKPKIWSMGPDGEDNGGTSGDDVSNQRRTK
ncbi:MAG: type II secretion system protein GspG [Planctomycetaceae bacterium]